MTLKSNKYRNVALRRSDNVLFRPGNLVRVHPAVVGGKGRHYGRAKIVFVTDHEAGILPLGRHRKTERVRLACLKKWKSKSRI